MSKKICSNCGSEFYGRGCPSCDYGLKVNKNERRRINNREKTKDMNRDCLESR
jgi:hypothetical protein